MLNWNRLSMHAPVKTTRKTHTARQCNSSPSGITARRTGTKLCNQANDQRENEQEEEG
jgi:hypothetical protein